MPTVNRPPFWVPRGDQQDTVWSPQPRNSPIIPFLTKQKIFGAGGQVPTKRWLPYLTYDDPPMWQGSPLNSQAIAVTRTQVKVFGQPGQAPTKNWAPYLTNDDPPMWQGSPLNSQAIAVTRTQVKFFGQSGQAPTKNWGPYLTNDDPPMWQGSPTGAYPLNRIPLRPFTLFTPYVWSQDYDDPPMWQATFERNLSLLFPTHNPFSNRVWQWSDDASYWQGSPINSPVISFLTQQKVFGAGGQVPPFRPNFTYDDATYWSGEPTNSAVIQLLTEQKLFGQGGQVPPYRWNYTLDDPPSWQPWIQRNIGLLSVAPSPFSNRQWQWSDDAAGWQGSPLSSAAPIQLLTAQRIFGQGGQVPPFRPNFTYDDASYWSGEPVNSAAIQILTQQTVFGQGGQAVPFRWNYTLDDASTWQWPLYERNANVLQPTPSARVVLRPSFYVPRPSDDSPWLAQSDASYIVSYPPTAGPPFSNRQWQWSDDPPQWQGAPVSSAVISLTAFVLYVPAPAPWMDEDDAPPWRQAPQRNLSLLTPTTAPFNNYKVYWYSEDSGWQGSPVRSAAIPLLTQQKVFGQGGQVPPFRWNATYDDPPPWQWPLYERNPNVLLPSGEPFNNYKTYWYSEDSFWQGAPLSSRAINVTTTQVKVYGQPGQAPPFRPNFTYDDASTWQWPLYERNANVLQPSGQPFNNYKWQWSDDAAFWQGSPLPSVAITLTSFALYKPGVAYPPPADDFSVWPAEPLGRNLQLLQTLSPFSNRQTYWYSEDAWWNAKPVRSAAITLLTQQNVFGQGGQVVPFRWNYTIDDPPMWPGPVPRGSAAMQLPVTGRVLNLYAPFNWTYTFDSPPMWQGVPASFNYLLTQPNPPAKPSGNDWIDFRRRARRR